MSNFIDQNRPFSAEEKEWLQTRASGQSLIDMNDAQFGHLSAEEKDTLRGQSEADLAEDQAAAARAQQVEDEQFHPEDLAQVAPLSTAEVRLRLESHGLVPEGETLEELQLQLLEYYDDARAADEVAPEENPETGE